MKEEWTNNLRKQVGDYEADVPAGLLDGIKQELSRRETKAESRRGFVVPLPVIRRVAAAAVVVLVTVSMTRTEAKFRAIQGTMTLRSCRGLFN